jgi:hypothetical protein
VLAVSNNGVEAERYGLFYTAPQGFVDGLAEQVERFGIWHRVSVPATLKGSALLANRQAQPLLASTQTQSCP